jgi:endoglucanase
MPDNRASGTLLVLCFAFSLSALACASEPGSAGGDDGGALGGSGTGGTAGAGGAAGAGGKVGAGGASGAGGATGAGGAGGQAATGGAGGTVSSSGSWRGINLSVAEWGKLPGVYGTDYTYPTHAEIDSYTALGMTIFRIPFAWERMQPTLGGDLAAAELAHLDDVVSYATGKGARMIVDPHNYARYNGQIIGGGSVTAANFADLWGKLGAHYHDNPLVIFGLMNEPHDIDVHAWLDAANGAIAAIRGAGATNLIFVPGTNWTGAYSWTSGTGANDNRVMLGVVDSGNNYAYEVHQYLDSDFSGTHATCQSTTIGTTSLQPFMAWLQQNGKRGFLGEFGGGQDQTCLTAVDGMMTLIESNASVWLGWTWWAGGPWWRGPQNMAIDDGTNPPQLMLMATHLAK